jgi:hypothetical protein
MAQPVIISDNISIAAGATNQNVINSNPSLRRYLRSPFRAQGKIVFVQSAAGLLVDFDVGSKNLVASSAPRVRTDMCEPDDVINDQWYVEAGDLMVLKVTNPTAGALSLRYRIVLQEVAERGPDCRVIQQGPISVAAAAVDVQLLDGLRYERPPVDSLLNEFASASATGLVMALDIDTDNVSPPSSVIPTNRMPPEPFDMLIEGVEVPQDKLTLLSVSNPTGGAISVYWKAKWYEQVVR